MPQAADARDASTYSDLLADHVWRRWTLVSAISRLPNAVAPLALVIVGRYATGSFACGALLAGAYAFSQALAAPWLGRLLDRRERCRGLAIALGSTSVALTALLICAVSRAPLALLLVATIAAGALPSAVQSGLRAFLVDLFAERAPLAFALDASLIELQWMSGPALVALLALLKLPYLTVAAMLAATLAALLATQSLPRSEPDLETDETRQSPWREPTAVRLYVLSVIQGYAEGTVTVALPPLLVALHTRAGLAGFLLVGLGLASAAGGLLFGALGARTPGTRGQQATAAVVTLGLLALPIAIATPVVVAAVAVASFGLPIAPLNTLRTQLLADAVAAPQRGEAFSILWGAMGIGTGLGGVAVGALLGVVGASGAIVVAGVAAILGGLANGLTGLPGASLRARDNAGRRRAGAIDRRD